MTHARTLLRHAAAAALTGFPTCAARVFTNRLRPLRDADLPCLLVNTDDEQIDTQGIGVSPLQERTLHLSVRAVDKLSDSLDDTLDTMLAEVEVALDAQKTLGGLAQGMTLQSVAIEMSDDLDKPIGVAIATYLVTYYTAAGHPETAF